MWIISACENATDMQEKEFNVQGKLESLKQKINLISAGN